MSFPYMACGLAALIGAATGLIAAGVFIARSFDRYKTDSPPNDSPTAERQKRFLRGVLDAIAAILTGL